MDDEAENLTQEVLLVVVRELNRFERREGSLRAWLRAIAVNRTRSHWRGRRPLAGLTGLDETEHFLARLEDPQRDLPDKSR